MRYYQMEQRQPEALFWKRRHAIDWHAAPSALDPRVMLRTVQAEPDIHALAPDESLVRPRVLRAKQECCAHPTPAHEVRGRMRTVAPLGDRRVLVALQELVSRGMLAVDMGFGV